MPTKKWANWSRFKNPGPFNYRHFAKYGRHPDDELVFFNKIGTDAVPRRLLPNVDKAIKVIEECDLAPLTADQRENRKTDVRNTLGRIDGWKRYEKAEPSAAAEKKRFLERARDIRQAAAVFAEVMGELGHASITESIAIAREQAEAWERMAAAYVVQRHKPKPSRSKELAVMEAWWLLTGFRKWHPGVTRKGPWQTLSSILYDGKERSIGIEYLQRKHDEMCQKSEEAWATVEHAKSKAC